MGDGCHVTYGHEQRRVVHHFVGAGDGEGAELAAYLSLTGDV